MPDLEEKREKGMSLMFAGLAVLVAALLVIFFLPGGVRVGSQKTFLAIIGVLGALGLILVVSGWFMRRRTDEG
jgi:high-affinity Fe2+/Pb2+ permease